MKTGSMRCFQGVWGHGHSQVSSSASTPRVSGGPGLGVFRVDVEFQLSTLMCFFEF